VFLKYFIHQRHRNDTHYVWCSEIFDSRTAGAYNPVALVPPTSNPADIYRDLKTAVERSDLHNPKIIEQKASLIARATEWHLNGEIGTDVRDEIIFHAQRGDFKYWRPLLYIIPCTPALTPRMQSVPAHLRAGLGPEYIIPDLLGSEFHLIEL
jgi:hypothetical protein